MSEPLSAFRWGELLEIVESRVDMKDEDLFNLASIRRRNGGFFHRETLSGKEIITKTLSKAISGTFAISRMQVVHGACSYVPDNFGGTFLSASYTQFMPKNPPKIDIKYLHYYAHLHESYSAFLKSSHGVHIEKMTFDLNDWLRQKVSLPPIPEQKKIAAILTSVDEVIEATQKQIDKLQDLKKATMNELLTKGIGHTEFKYSELGRIPKSWDVKKLDDVTIRGSGHTPDKQNPSYWNGGIKWVSLADSSSLDNRLIGSTDKEISADGLKNSSAVLHPDGTVILSRDAGVGKSAVLLGEMAVSQHFMAWRCGDKIENWFLYYLLQSLKPLFDTVAIGSTIKTIGLGFFKQMQIVCPPKDEQMQISSILLKIEDHIDHMKQKLVQIQSLKKSLMQDLLTGKVRVEVD